MGKSSKKVSVFSLIVLLDPEPFFVAVAHVKEEVIRLYLLFDFNCIQFLTLQQLGNFKQILREAVTFFDVTILDKIIINRVKLSFSPYFSSIYLFYFFSYVSIASTLN